MTAPEPDYRITKPSGSSVLIESRTPSSDVGGIIVTSRDNMTNPSNEIVDVSVRPEEESRHDDSYDSGLGLRPPVSGQVVGEVGDDAEAERDNIGAGERAVREALTRSVFPESERD